METITNTLVFRIEQLAWREADGVGNVEALPVNPGWMKATAEDVGVPACVVEAIVGDMRLHTHYRWHMPHRSTEIGANHFTM